MLERVYFNADDNIELVGLLSYPEIKTDEIVISIHGMQSNCMKRREDILSNKVNQKNIAYFSFNNRGHELMSYTKETNGKKKLNGGSVYEDVLDGYYDIKGAIDEMIKLGFKKIHLQGHSLGCTKIVYTYNKLKRENSELLKSIKSIILLSLVDIPDCQKYDLGIKKIDEILELAEQKEKEGKQNDLMPVECFEHPISVRTYLRYFKYNEEIDFARFWDKNYDFKELNNINIPLLLRWGETDLLVQKLDYLMGFLKEKINNPNLNINYIDGTNHGYTGREDILGEQIAEFIKTQN